MNRVWKKLVSVVLLLALAAQSVVVSALADELDPTNKLTLFVPNAVRQLVEANEGLSCYYLQETSYSVPETGDKLYIPIQRTGDVSREGHITVKLIDMSSHYDVNYRADFFRVDAETVNEYEPVAMIDLLSDPENVEEIGKDEMDAVMALAEQQGGVDIVDSAGNVVGEMTAPDSGDQPAAEQAAPSVAPDESAVPGAAAEEVPDNALIDPKNPLKTARNQYFGNVSDRQPMESSQSLEGGAFLGLRSDEMNSVGSDGTPLGSDDFPGREYLIPFAPNETLKILVITPLYSERADGDCTISLMLRDPEEGAMLQDDYSIGQVVIEDVDEPEDVHVSFSEPEYRAEDGRVFVTVTRQGSLNNMVGVRLASSDGSAEMGKDYTGVDAALYFPMGLTQRTVELPVGHGADDLDFNLHLNSISDCLIDIRTAHVVIPAAEGEAELASNIVLDDHLDEAYSLENATGDGWISGVGGRTMSTRGLSSETNQITYLNLVNTCYYDGVRVVWTLNEGVLCNPRTSISFREGTTVDQKVYTGGKSYEGRTDYLFFGRGNSMDKLEIVTFTYGSLFKGHEMTIHSVEPLLRQFRFVLNPADVKSIPLRGVSEEEMGKYTSVILGSSLTDTDVTVWGEENFSVTRSNACPYLKLVGLEAFDAKTGKTYRVADVSLGSDTATVVVDRELIENLAGLGLVNWSDNSALKAEVDAYYSTISVWNDALRGPANPGKPQLGTIQIRPVFERIPARVVLAQHDYGSLSAAYPDPKTGELIEVPWTDGGNDDTGIVEYYDAHPELEKPFYYDWFAWLDRVLAPETPKARVSEAEDWFYGEKITLTNTISDRGRQLGVAPLGIGYEKRESEGSAFFQKSDDYFPGAETRMTYTLGAPYTLFLPTFSATENSITVLISEADREKFDLNEGIFKDRIGVYDSASGLYAYTVVDTIKANEVAELMAYPKNKEAIPLWIPQFNNANENIYSGVFFPVRARALAEENKVLLRLSENKDDQQVYQLSGALMAEELNISSGLPTGKLNPADGAVMSMGMSAAVIGLDGADDGSFAMTPITLVRGTRARLTVTYNGSVELREAALPAGGMAVESVTAIGVDGQAVTRQAAIIDMGIVRLPCWSTGSAHFTDFYLSQNRKYVTGANILEMNGSETVLTAKVEDGQTYFYDGESHTEHILAVKFYFFNPRTGAVKGPFEAEKADELTWKYTFDKFAPDKPDQYSYGDVLYAELITDKMAPGLSIPGFDGRMDMTYDKVSTGFAVITDMDYDPAVFDWDLDVTPEGLGLDEAALEADDDTKAAFGKFPFLGAIQMTIRAWGVLKKVKALSKGFHNKAEQAAKETLELLAHDPDTSFEESFTESDGDPALQGISALNPLKYLGGESNISLLLDIQELPYGGVRMKVGFAMITGNASFMKRHRGWTSFVDFCNTRCPGEDNVDYNNMQQIGDPGESDELEAQLQEPGDMAPYSSIDILKSQFFGVGGLFKGKQNIKDTLSGRRAHTYNNNVAGPYLSVGIFLGVYFDFGYVQNFRTNADGTRSPVGEAEYLCMGTGGFLGGNFTVGYMWPFLLVVVPCYAGIEGTADLTFYLGKGGNPQLALEDFESSQDGLQLTRDKWNWQFDIVIKGGVTAYVGVGVASVLGARFNFGVEILFTYSPKMLDWYPALNSNTGVKTNFVMSGVLNLILVNLPLYTYSYPLPLDTGFESYFRAVHTAYNLISYIRNNMTTYHDTGSYDGISWSAIPRSWVDEMLRDINALEDLCNSDLCGESGIIERIDRASQLLRETAYQRYFLSRVDYLDSMSPWSGGFYRTHTWIMNFFLKTDRQKFNDLVSENAGSSAPVAERPVDPSLQADSARLMTDLGDKIPGFNAYYIPGHVNSRWTADEASLSAAYSVASSQTVVDNALAQPDAKLIPLDGTKQLVVFLDDDTGRSAAQKSTLKYAVLDTADMSWTEPQTVQGDGTADLQPNLTDTGDSIMISWVSMTPESAEALEERVRTGQMDLFATDSASRLEIYTVLYNKSSGTLGEIEQLTDDEFMDSCPQGIYDEKSGDRLVMYVKSAPDSDFAPENDLEEVLALGSAYSEVYSVMTYRLWDHAEQQWKNDYYEGELRDPSANPDILAQWNGQRFLPSAIKTQTPDGETVDLDPPIGDLTSCYVKDGIAAYAYTIDTDRDGDTGSDKELILQFYDFDDHTNYVPLRVTYDSHMDSSPRLVKSGGSAWLFWLRDAADVMYLNVTEMLNATLPAQPGEAGAIELTNEDGTVYVKQGYAVLPDGTFAEGYTPDIRRVSTESATSDGELGALINYQVFADRNDDLYVVWTANTAYTDPDGKKKDTVEIFATARIIEEDQKLPVTVVDEKGNTVTMEHVDAAWSKPYQLTKTHYVNDGLAVSVAEDGSLLLMHNQFDRVYRGDDPLWVQAHTITGVDLDGEERSMLDADPYEDSEIRLMLTKCLPVGSLSVNSVSYSDVTPMPGDTINVSAVIENAGLTTARGYDIQVNAIEGGKSRAIKHLDSDERIPVNTARIMNFDWTVPDTMESLEGAQLEFVIKEKIPGGGHYEDTGRRTQAFILMDDVEFTLDGAVQNGDKFDVTYTVYNNGNAPVPEGRALRLNLLGLYADLEEYGVEDDVLLTVDLSGWKPGQGGTFTESVEIPLSLFEKNGYDAVNMDYIEANGGRLDSCDDVFVTMTEPVNFRVNDTENMSLKSDETRQLTVSFDGPFLGEERVTYTVGDTSVATVTDGVLTAHGAGTTTVTATLLPAGCTDSFTVTVSDGTQPAPVEPVEPVEPVTPQPTTDPDSVTVKAEEIAAARDDTIPVKVSGSVVKLDTEAMKKATQGGSDAVVTVKKNADGSTNVDVTVDGKTVPADVTVELPSAGGQVLARILPGGTQQIIKKSIVENGTVRALIPAGATVRVIDNAKSFPDVKDTDWFKAAVGFVSSHELFQGTTKGFEPEEPMTRAMLATVICRMENSEARGENPFADVPDDEWYTNAVIWASENGIVKGTTKGFEPDAPVTREQMATMLYRYAKYLGLDVSGSAPLGGFPDGGEVSDWAREAMQWAVSAGLFRGNTDGTLNPTGNVSRAEVATLLQRMVRLIVK
ncbi:MAG: S-layer homology domain-containing protein [Oscillospiraceae bacterium]|nr:S-layer homology domain-containing protein [Oscillospiraceae bacterium]